MPRGDLYRVCWCPVDPYIKPPDPAYDPVTAALTKTHLAGLLNDGYAPVGMVLEDQGGQAWVVYPYHWPSGEVEQVLVAVEPCGEGYCIQSPQRMIRAINSGRMLGTPEEREVFR
jgi:hypothetical protein